MSHHIIRTIRTTHCKRGPQRCAICRQMNAARICLLDIDPPQPGMMQRRTIEVEIDGKRVWREFDVVRAFASEEQALAYAATHHIQDIALAD